MYICEADICEKGKRDVTEELLVCISMYQTPNIIYLINNLSADKTRHG